MVSQRGQLGWTTFLYCTVLPSIFIFHKDVWKEKVRVHSQKNQRPRHLPLHIGVLTLTRAVFFPKQFSKACTQTGWKRKKHDSSLINVARQHWETGLHAMLQHGPGTARRFLFKSPIRHTVDRYETLDVLLDCDKLLSSASCYATANDRVSMGHCVCGAVNV